MHIKPQKYWHDIIAPIVRRDPPPTIPQAVVLWEQHVLLVKRDNPALWELPGGGMHPRETPEQTVVREVREETGLRISIYRQLRIIEHYFYYDPLKAPYHMYMIFCLCGIVGGTLRGSGSNGDEAHRPTWVPIRTLRRTQFDPVLWPVRRQRQWEQSGLKLRESSSV